MARKAQEDILHDGSVKKWHSWKDSAGMPFSPVYWREGHIYTVYGKRIASCGSLEDLIQVATQNKLFIICHDILDEKDFPFSNELIGHESSTPYLSRSGRIAALRLSTKKRSGFLIPASTWGIDSIPDEESLANIIRVALMFDYQSTTPGSLSEKVLRSTLADIIRISRPSIALREDILENNVGGRIDRAARRQFFREVYEYDKIKAYTFHSRIVPDPSIAPSFHIIPRLDFAMSFATGWWLVSLRARLLPIAPIQVNSNYPKEGEAITRWLWSEEIISCIQAGYTIETIHKGYGFPAMSNFMEEWSDIMWKKYILAQDMHPQVQDIIKSMMVSLPGRFLRRPESYRLIPLSEAHARTPGRDDGDMPLRLHLGPSWERGDRILSDYAIRAEYEKESTALSHIGSYIVMSMRNELYHMMLKEHQNGRRVIRSYIDCYALDGPTTLGAVGTDLGQWKEKRYGRCVAEENRFIGINLSSGATDVVAPGMEQGGERREQFVQGYEAGAQMY